ncbi:putative transposase [Nitrobacter sp. Nb-311A]|nr:putative transposase [Nitrobacter sp. Nb-311A]
MRPGAGVFKLDMARILADETNDLTPMMRTMLRELWDEFVVVDARLATVSRQVEAIADRVDAARRLMSPGLGHWEQRPCLPQSEMDGSSARRVTLRHGSGSFHAKTRQAGGPRCWGSASAATRTCGASSSMAHAHASPT